MKLYRYRQLTEYSVKEVTQGHLWFSSFSDFNDPFEGKVRLEARGTKEDYLSYFKSIPEMNSLSDAFLDNQAEIYAENPASFELKINAVREKVAERHGVCCMSENNNNMLMWSHYTNGHTGVCIEYNYNKLIQLPLSIFPVDYTNEYPTIDYVRHHKNYEKLGYEIFSKKAEDWSYEREWRLLSVGRTGRIDIPDGTITRVILGCRTDKNSILCRELVKCLNDRGIALSYAKIYDDRYGLEIID